MELPVFRRDSDGLATRMSAALQSPPPAAGRRLSRASVGSLRSSLGSSSSSSATPPHSSHSHNHSHAVYSPRAFHRLSTPSESQASPTSLFSLFARAQSPFRPSDGDHITEIDEASGYNSHTGRRYSSVLGSPPQPQPRHHHRTSAASPRKPGEQPAATATLGGRRATLDSRRRSSMQYSVGGTPSRLSTKWDRTPWYALGFGWRPRRSQLRRLCFWCGAVGLFLFCFSLVFVLPRDLQRLAPVVIGALLSFISALTILVSFLLQPQTRRYPNELLVYVALCEFGLAVLALTHVMAYCSDASYTCRPLSLHACGTTTALEMFLLLASVGWFGCAILHLFVSVSNPFANYKSQLKRYHTAVWGGSLVVSVAVPLCVFSGAAQTRYEMSSAELCRAVGLHFALLPAFASDEDRAVRVGQWQTLNMEYWGVLFALVVLLVIAAQLILALGWWRSNSGTVIALKARRRMMKRMTTYVHTLNATWLLILVVFFTYRSNGGALRHLAQLSVAASAARPLAPSAVGLNVLDAFFHYILAAKGFFTCVVWLAVNRHCCALGGLSLCKDPYAAASSSGGYSSDEEDDSDHEANPFSLASLAARRRRAATLPTTTTITTATAATGRHSTTSSTRPSALAATNSLSFATVANSSSASAASATAAAVFASQNNETLQREIIYYTVCGITKSILKSSQNADAEVFFQQLMVGADRESSLLAVAPHHHQQQQQQQQQHDAHADWTGASPRAYCQAAASYHQYQSHDYSMASTAGADASVSSSVGPSVSFAAAARPSTLLSVRDPASSSASREDAFDSATSSGSASLQGRPPPPPPQRFSMYPVSHVPFELFEQEIELQSHRSSEGSLSLSPIFANLRRTAHALYSSNNVKTATNAIENPRPKMFIDYAPTEFRAIRRAFGLSDEMYLASFRSTAKERVSAGSSGAFMFFSGDNALIVKSMKEKECRKLVKMVPAYADFITSHPKSRIIRFFGCHRIRLYGRNFYFVVMSNVLHSTVHTPTITEKYDVKGSWIDRQAKLPQPGDLVTCSECNATYEYGRGDASTTFPFHVHRPDTILKDLDMTRPLRMGRRVARELFEQLAMDCEFLNSMGIMDYSLLVGVHRCSLAEQPWRRDFLANTSFLQSSDGHDSHDNGDRDDDDSDDASPLGGRASSGVHLEPIPESGESPEEVYFVGIIDILQEWNWEKQLEKVGKTLIGKSSSGISAVAPDAYCERFKARLAQVLRLHEDGESDEGDTKQLVKQPSLHPVVSADDELAPLEFQLRESLRYQEAEGDGDGDEEEEEEEEKDRVDSLRGSALTDEALQFEAEAIAVSMDLEGGRVSQRL